MRPLSALWLLGLLLVPLAASAHVVEPTPVDCQSSSQPPFLIFGATTSGCGIDSAGELDEFEFFGQPEDPLRLVVASEAPGLDLHATLRDPDGVELANGSCDGGTDALCRFELNHQLPNVIHVGQHTIEVRDDGGDEVGAYALQLERIPAFAPEQEIPLSSQSFVDFSFFAHDTDVDQVAFEAQGPDRVEVSVESNAEYLDPRIEIVDAAGTPLAEASCDGGEPPAPGLKCTMRVEAAISSPELESYTIVFSEVGHDQSGSLGSQSGYEFTFQRLPEPSAGSGAIALLSLVSLARARRAQRSSRTFPSDGTRLAFSTKSRVQPGGAMRPLGGASRFRRGGDPNTAR